MRTRRNVLKLLADAVLAACAPVAALAKVAPKVHRPEPQPEYYQVGWTVEFDHASKDSAWFNLGIATCVAVYADGRRVAVDLPDGKPNGKTGKVITTNVYGEIDFSRLSVVNE